MMTPSEVISSFVRHMKIESRLGLVTLDGAAQKSMPALLARLRALKPSMDEVSAALEKLTTDECSAFSEGQTSEIASVVKATMVDNATVAPRTTVKTQHHPHLHKYLPMRLWGCFGSDDTIENKFKQLAEFMCQVLGLRNPDEQTKRLAVVVVHLACNLTPSPHAAFEDVTMFNNILDQKRSSIPTKQTMSVFPDNPQQFIDAFPCAYGAGDPPVECRVSLSAIVERCKSGVTPCRSSNRHVARVAKVAQADIARPSLVASTSVDPVNGTLLSILEKFMFRPRESPHVGEPCTPLVEELGMRRESLSRKGSSSSVESGRSMFSGGGIPPSCLDPCHDKIGLLKRKLCGDEGGVADCEPLPPLPRVERAPVDVPPLIGAPPTAEVPPRIGHAKLDAASGKVVPLRRISKKRKLVAPVGRGDGGALPAAAKGSPSAMKRKAPARLSPKARPRKSEKTKPSPYEHLLKKPIRIIRPRQSQGPTKHAGGKIYWSKPKGAYRVYLRIGDKVDKPIRANPECINDMKHKFEIACALIEDDKRPVVA